VGVDDGASVERIVVALAGVPLAIELAAARLPDVGLGGLVKATDSLLDVLTEGERDLPVRQQTLRAALTWSHDLLNVEERRVFARLAVFAGGIPSEAVDAVCGEGSRPAVVELAAKSLVHLDGERLSMLEPIRQFAAEHLDAIGESQERGVAHAAWFRDLAEDADPALLGPTQGEWLHRLADLHDNFDAALRHGAGRPELELRLAAALARYWYVRGHWSEGRAALARALKGTGDPGTRANALVGAGALAIAQGDLDAADSLLTEARSDAATAGDALTGAKAANGRAEVARLRGDLDQAGTLLDEAEASAGDDVALAASIRINQGLVALGAGDLEGAATALDDAITRYTKMGNARGAGLATVNRGRIAHLLGDKEGAETRYRLALEELNRLGEQAGLAAALENLGVLLDDADEVDDRMPPILEQHLRVRRDLGDEPGEARALFQLGKLEFDLDHFESAIEWFDEAKAIVARQGNEAILAGVESLRSRCLAATGRPAEAVEAAAASALSFAAAGNVDAAGTMRSLADRYREEAAGAGAPTASS
jgi:tetratricopeptide (TPR) repeat protein